MKRYNQLGLSKPGKVTSLFAKVAIVVLALLVIYVGFAAKHGQFESPAQHGHFLSKSIKMETLSHDLDAALSFEAAPMPVHFEALSLIHPAPAILTFITLPARFSLPLLV
jgi:hypothetical protein